MAQDGLAGKVAVVTGAGRGIGRAIAEAWARAGAAVCLSARSAAEIEDARAAIERAGGRAIAAVADVTDHASVEALFARATRELGGVDLVLANAGDSVQNEPVEQSDPASWRRTVEVNLVGVFHTAHAAIPHLKRRGGGKILVTGSGMGHRAAPTRSAYAASKAGAWMLVRVLAQELAADGICVNEIVPGPVNTAFIRSRAAQLNAATGGGEWFKEPGDLAPLALFLATLPAHGPTGQSFSLARREL